MSGFEWPETLTRDGDTITRAEMTLAFSLWPGGHHMLLASQIGKAAGRDAKTRNYQWHRHADAMIQRARKAGIVRLGAKRQWERVE